MKQTRSTRRRLVIISAVALLVAMISTPAAGSGPDPDRLAQAGWFCFGHEDPAIHCLPNGGDGVFSGEAASSLIMTWGTATGEFWGTELLIHEDLYNGQPCPQDSLDQLGDGEPGAYIHLSDLGLPLPYFVCHHFDSPFT